MDQKTTLVDVIKLIYKRRKQIIIATIAVSLLTAIVMLLMPNYFKATSTFYAASPDLSKPDPIGNSLDEKKYYGDKNDIDRMLTIGNSNNIKDYLIDEFDLFNHYEIDSTEKFSKFKLRKKLDKLFKVKKNEKDAIELTVEDKDKIIAANMANSAREKIKTEVHNLIKRTQKTQIDGYNKKITSKTTELNKLLDSIGSLKNKYSIYDIETQGEGLGQQVTQTKSNLSFQKSKLKEVLKDRFAKRDSINQLKANIAGNKSKLKVLDSIAKVFNKGSLTIALLATQKRQFSNQLSLDKEKLNQLNSIYNSDFTVLHIVEKAEVPLRKFRPKRSIYVIGAFLLTLFFSVMIVLILEEGKKVNWFKD